MRRLLAVAVCGFCVSSVIAAIGCGPNPVAPDRGLRKVAIAVADQGLPIGSGVTIILAPGETLQLSAKGTLGDGSPADVTFYATWSSDDPAIVSVSQGGVVTGVAKGTTRIRVKVSGVEGEAAFATGPLS